MEVEGEEEEEEEDDILRVSAKDLLRFSVEVFCSVVGFGSEHTALGAAENGFAGMDELENGLLPEGGLENGLLLDEEVENGFAPAGFASSVELNKKLPVPIFGAFSASSGSGFFSSLVSSTTTGADFCGATFTPRNILTLPFFLLQVLLLQAYT